MEPAINPDLTHSVQAPEDLTLAQLRDVGWFLDANVDGIPDDFQICIDQGSSIFTYNSSTGQYLFFDCSKGIVITGTGTLGQFFCKLTLTDKGPIPKHPDRNISVVVNPCTGNATATISHTSLAKPVVITDNNINSGACGCN